MDDLSVRCVEHANIQFTLNGKDVNCLVPVRRNLVDFLRQDMGLTAAHVGCEVGVCGACNVRVDGAVVRGCLMLAVQVDGLSVETLEGLAESGEIAALQRAFVTRNAMQCGFCTPGMLMTANELLQAKACPSRLEIRDAISGNYCRCTGYQAIVDAIEIAAGEDA
ncbi:(2Fe-2S)-binding protein [Herbaspirillum sp. C7C2]|uniref:(2Fe-2S)-binding protein n=1 Tax=Herbaspirillum sp. C7C2 TaxID=2736666 RepID=UPI001F51FED6|nr:(2Fe-2S)-binding protein [Herbaspirillum sp. C7C2]MCI1015397.1 (2Fe-2S)-binding protein [Herbaspirillum sp. C7C2]